MALRFASVRALRRVLLVPRRPMGSFSVCSYNILAKSLGSCCIPWVLDLSEELNAAVQDETGKAFSELQRELTVAYRETFHRNYESGSKNGMRDLWGLAVDAPADIPVELVNVEFAGVDTVLAPVPSAAAGEKRNALTMRGMLRIAACIGIGRGEFQAQP